MFQLWKLVLLCSLLTGTSASLLDHLLKDLNTAVNNLESVLDKGLETVDNRLEPITQELKAELGVLQETKSSQEVDQKVENVENLLSDILATAFQIVERITGLKISDISILDIEPELTSDGNGVTLRIPVTFNISLTLPLFGKIADLSAFFDLQTTVTVETDAETGVSTVVMEECTADLPNFSLTLLDSRLSLVNKIVNTLAKDLKKIVSLIVEKELCPEIQTLVEDLDVNFVNDLIAELQENQQTQDGTEEGAGDSAATDPTQGKA
nr:BPI fold-containing family A member 2 [Vicugna pacos]